MLAVALALGAAAVYGTGTALQHHAATGVTSHTAVARPLLLQRLRHQPGWVLGLVLSVVAFGLHVAALQRGPLTLVQPVVVMTIVFAVVVRACLERTPPSLAEIVWCVCTWAGISVFVASVPQGPPPHLADHRIARLAVIAGVVLAAGSAVWASRTGALARRGFLLGVAAGVLYGLTAGLIKISSVYARHGLGPLVEHWSSWLAVLTGVGAFVLSQWAYEASRLSVSVPTLNVVDVLVASTFGLAVFGEHLFEEGRQLAVELLGIALAVVGVWRLVRESERLHDNEAPGFELPGP